MCIIIRSISMIYLYLLYIYIYILFLCVFVDKREGRVGRKKGALKFFIYF